MVLDDDLIQNFLKMDSCYKMTDKVKFTLKKQTLKKLFYLLSVFPYFPSTF